MSVVAAPADKRFRRAHVKPGRRRSKWRTVVRPAAAVLFVVALGAVVFYQGGALLARASVLHIDRIVVRGNVRVTSEAVLAALDGLGGQNLMSADLDTWRQKVRASPWVRDVTLRRVLPSTVEVTLTERTPVAIARVKGKLMLVDAEGMLIDHFGPRYAGVDLPIVDGLGEGLGDGRDVPVPEPGTLVDAVRASLAARILASVQSQAQIAKRLSQVDVTDAHNANVRLDGDPAVLHLGDTEFLPRLQTYLQLAQTLRANVSDIQYVDLRFGERIFVGPAGRDQSIASEVGPAGRSGRRTRHGRTRE